MSKPHDHIKNTVVWPHMKLWVRYSTTRGLHFDHLDLLFLVAGELELVTSGEISERERRSRLNILKDLMCAAGFYEWSAVKRLFVAVVTEIKMGVREWGEDTSRLEQKILMQFPLRKSNNTIVNKGKPSTGGSGAGSLKRGIRFCSDYQRKECVHKEAHSFLW